MSTAKKLSARARTRAQTERVEKAVKKAQARIPTAFHITVVPFDREEKREAKKDGMLMSIGRTGRGADDSTHFVMSFDPVVSAKVSFPNLVKVAGHETLHALLWPITEMAQREGMSEEDMERLRKENETLTYKLQRAIFGELTV